MRSTSAITRSRVMPGGILMSASKWHSLGIMLTFTPPSSSPTLSVTLSVMAPAPAPIAASDASRASSMADMTLCGSSTARSSIWPSAPMSWVATSVALFVRWV